MSIPLQSLHLAVAAVLLVAGSPVSPVMAADETVQVFDAAPIEYRPGDTTLAAAARANYVVRQNGQAIERTLDLPAAPVLQRDARRIVVHLRVRPVPITVDGRQRPSDPWTRLGNVLVLSKDANGRPQATELIRFTTGYGAAGSYRADVTALAPLLHGQVTLRVSISTYSNPGWQFTLALAYTDEGVGPRRPAYVQRLFVAPRVTAESPVLATTITVPDGLDPPRIRIISTGHASDGRAGNEFKSCTHILRVDGVEIARWRPWSEQGGPLRSANPWAGRFRLDGRELRSSDFDRTGWNPGLKVDPLIIPVPELTPGEHRVAIEVVGIRPKEESEEPDGREHFGYWNLSATVVADDPWPGQSLP